MIPPRREFEKVAVDDWINGEISEITYDLKHQFKTSEGPAVRIKINLFGYKFPKSSPWMLFSYSKMSNLYILFIDPLVEGAREHMNFDLDQLKGMKIKIMFEAKGEYQNIVRLRPSDRKVKPDTVYMNQDKATDLVEMAEVSDEEPPF